MTVVAEKKWNRTGCRSVASDGGEAPSNLDSRYRIKFYSTKTIRIFVTMKARVLVSFSKLQSQIWKQEKLTIFVPLLRTQPVLFSDLLRE